ncbi:MAG: hypothetical protein MPJ50_16680 [Pirellulales bacterium]|nr:hypothetical protein [Pirellulales bacterium]
MPSTTRGQRRGLLAFVAFEELDCLLGCQFQTPGSETYDNYPIQAGAKTVASTGHEREKRAKA